jgi:hypothetical protein
MSRTTDERLVDHREWVDWRLQANAAAGIRLRVTAIVDDLEVERDRADKAEANLRSSEASSNQHLLNLAIAQARLAAVRAFAEEMRGYCSPNGVAVMYADRLVAVLDGEVGA